MHVARMHGRKILFSPALKQMCAYSAIGIACARLRNALNPDVGAWNYYYNRAANVYTRSSSNYPIAFFNVMRTEDLYFGICAGRATGRENWSIRVRMDGWPERYIQEAWHLFRNDKRAKQFSTH
jgi:hypothetical protein